MIQFKLELIYMNLTNPYRAVDSSTLVQIRIMIAAIKLDSLVHHLVWLLFIVDTKTNLQKIYQLVIR